MDETPNNSEITKQLKDNGGYGITHTGRIARVDNSDFSVQDGLDSLRAFVLFLSFCRGRFVGMPIIRGLDSLGKNVYEEWIAPTVSPWKGSLSWFPARDTGDLCPAWSTFLDLWRNKDWRDTLLYTVQWYVNANECTAALEGSIVLAQIALERLAWMVLVIDRKAISAEGFNKLRAADMLSLLFNQLSIPPHLPPGLSDLAKYCKANALGNLSESIAHFRNAVVHPPKKSKTSPGHQILYEAWKAELWGLELSLLAILGYTGGYDNRVGKESKWSGHTELVPWVTSPTSPDPSPA